MIHEFFDRVVCLTTNRWDRCKAELDKHGIVAERFKSVSAADAKKSFNQSQRRIMTELYESGATTALVLEDDVVFQNMEYLPGVLDDLARWEWDICYFGGNYLNHGEVKKPQKVSKRLRRIYNAWTTHAIAYNRTAIEHIAKNYRCQNIYDAWLDENVLGEMVTMATYPLLAVQQDGHSDLWGHEVNYSDAWQRSLDFIR